MFADPISYTEIFRISADIKKKVIKMQPLYQKTICKTVYVCLWVKDLCSQGL